VGNKKRWRVMPLRLHSPQGHPLHSVLTLSSLVVANAIAATAIATMERDFSYRNGVKMANRAVRQTITAV